jgi:aerobic carbon-monoxide dehydrogenase medium subunit
MKAAAFDYVRARSLPEALGLVARHGEGAKLIAGGQSLVAALNLRLMAPSILIDINHIDELRGIAVAGNVLTIGALTRHVEVQTSPLIAAHAPLLTKAIEHVAHPAIRNRGTLGGNLAYADPASELPACMLALDATIRVAGPAGVRAIAARDFFVGLFETTLAPGEILTGVDVPVSKAGHVDSFEELSRRSGDYAIVGLACHGVMSAGQFSQLNLGYFAVGDRPTLATRAAAELTGVPVTPAAIAAAQTALILDLHPQTDQQATPEMRLHLARVLLGRAIAGMTGVAAPVAAAVQSRPSIFVQGGHA